MKNIIYFDANDAEKFDLARFEKSLNRYAKVSRKDIEVALKDLENYENLHVSRLVETGAALIAKSSDLDTAKTYLDEHDQYFGSKFERLRRITGYLVGTVERWNDAKREELGDRVKHAAI